jgi:hypothetical protein
MDNTILRKDFLRSALGLPLLLTGGGRLAQVSAQSDSHNQAAPSAEELGKYYAKKRYDPAPLPQWQSVHGQLPSPIYESQPNWIAMYWKSWELAFRNFHEPATGSGFVSQFIDAAFNANIFLWDSCFMTMFCNYAHPLVPGIGTLDNFYAKQHEDGEICREIVRNTGVAFSQWVNRENRPLFSRWGKEPSTPFVPYDVVYRGRPAPKQNPQLTLDGLNHPILAWAELESYRMTGDTARLGRIWEPLVHYYAALQEYLRQGNGLYMTDWASMDNSTRNAYLDRGGTGIDISSEMVLFARQLSAIAGIQGKTAEASRFASEADRLAGIINQAMWDPQRRFYFDLTLDGKPAPVKTIAAFWPLLAKVASPDQAEALAAELVEKTGTIWENYAPDAATQGKPARQNFAGWSAIGPILYLMEYAIGLRADAPRNSLAWNLTPGIQHGCERYRFNGHVTSLVAKPLADRLGRFQVSVDSDGAFTLSLASGETKKDFTVRPGRQEFRI